ncbi:MAG: hypothetical protein GY786_12780 [Proteobacteria bacterium]|nr:hypothetical protein [Pseudomonadota bacterium]
MFPTCKKRIIAKIAVEIFSDGDSIMIQSGVTTDVLAHELSRKNGLTLISNSLTIANTIYQGT